VPYMVSGSVASMLYGEPRMTNDIDMIVHLTDQQALQLPELFPLEQFYCPPVQVILSESRRASRGHFNLIHHDTGHKADIYLRGSDELQAWGLSHRKQASLGPGQSLWLAPPEYVILRKLECCNNATGRTLFCNITLMV